MITDLDFANDVVIFAEKFEVLVPSLDTLSTKSKTHGLNVSWIKKFVASFDENIDILPPIAG